MPTNGTSGLDPRLRLVVVDDHDRARLALVRRLKTHVAIRVVGHTGDALESHQLVNEHAPHVVLADTNREDGMGYDLVSSLAAVPPAGRPVIVLHVAYFNPEHWEAARAAGADDLLLKRIDGEGVASALVASVRRVMAPERWPALLHA